MVSFFSQIEEALWLEKERNAQALFLAKKAWQEKEKKRKEDEEVGCDCE